MSRWMAYITALLGGICAVKCSLAVSVLAMRKKQKCVFFQLSTNLNTK